MNPKLDSIASIATVSLAVALPNAIASCATVLPSVEIPASATHITSEIRTHNLLVAYQDRAKAEVRAVALDGTSSWTKEFPGQYSAGFHTDRSGRTVAISLTPDSESPFTNVVVRDGRELFTWEGRGRLIVSPTGRYFYPLNAIGGATSTVLDEVGQTLELPSGLNIGANVSFIGEDHLLVATREIDKETSEGIPGTLALLQLPAEIVWAIPIQPGEFLIHSGNEAVVALDDNLLVIGEGGRGAKLYGIGVDGARLWEITLDEPPVAVAIRGNTVLTLLNRSVISLEGNTGRELRRDTFLEAPRQAPKTRSAFRGPQGMVFNVFLTEPSVPPWPASILVSFDEKEALHVKVLSNVSSMTVKDERFIGTSEASANKISAMEILP